MSIKLKWLIYSRASISEQWMGGLSLDYQKNMALDFAKANNISIDEKHIFEEIYSWTSFDRPKLWQIFDLIKKEKFDCIIIFKRDRLARDYWIFDQIKGIFDSFGIKIFYSDKIINWEDMIDDFV